MSDTTIRLDSAVRDKLRALADEEHITLGDLLGRLAEREQYQREMRRADEIMDRMQRADPAAWHEYVSELRGFEAGTARDGLSSAVTDWPEYSDPEYGDTEYGDAEYNDTEYGDAEYNDTDGSTPGAVPGR
jgi:hypothetical protein